MTWRDVWWRSEVAVFVFEKRVEGFLVGLVSTCLTRPFQCKYRVGHRKAIEVYIFYGVAMEFDYHSITTS